MMAYLNELIKF